MDLRQLQSKIPDEVRTVMCILQKHGYETYLVGGSVRDFLLGRFPPDYDMATSALPGETAALFCCVSDAGRAYGTITVYDQGIPVEITTMRKEGMYVDGRRPAQLVFSRSILDDLQRRDFTINAMAFDGGVLLDPYHGMRDLRCQMLRTVGNPDDRFREDGLRLFRTIRLSAQLGFAITNPTMDALVRNIGMSNHVAPERIRPELDGILLSRNPAQGCQLMAATGLLTNLGFTQSLSDEMLSIHYWQPLCRVPADSDARMALFILLNRRDGIESAGKQGWQEEYLEGLLAKYAFSRKNIDRIRGLIQEIHHFPYRSKAELRRMLKRLGKKNWEITAAFIRLAAEFQGFNLKEVCQWVNDIQEIVYLDECSSICELAINGDDLIHMGVPEGPQIGHILGELLDRVLDNPFLNKRERLMQLVQEELMESKDHGTI